MKETHVFAIFCACVLFAHFLIKSDVFKLEIVTTRLVSPQGQINKRKPCSSNEYCFLYPVKDSRETCFGEQVPLIVTPQNSVSNPRLAVIILFTITEFAFVELNLWSWKDSLFPPCSSSSAAKLSSQIDLVFYTNRPLVTKESTLVLKWLEDSGSRKCFNAVKFISINVDPQRDKSGHNALDMFYELWWDEYYGLVNLKEKPLLLERNSTHYVLIMEPDTRPIIPNWLEVVYDISASTVDFWMIGSAPQVADSTESIYMDKNALYHYGDLMLHKFIRCSKGSGST